MGAYAARTGRYSCSLGGVSPRSASARFKRSTTLGSNPVARTQHSADVDLRHAALFHAQFGVRCAESSQLQHDGKANRAASTTTVDASRNYDIVPIVWSARDGVRVELAA